MRRVLLAAAAIAGALLAGGALAQDPPAATEPGAALAPVVPPTAVPEEEPAPPEPVLRRRTVEEPAEDPVPAKPPEPLKRPRFASAILQATDKITAETLRFEAKVGEPVRYKGVVITVHACETTASDEPVFDSMAHLDVLSQPAAPPGRAAPAARQAFRGWTFAGSPALHPFEHPVYDLWLIACKAPAPSVAAGSA